MPGASEFLDNAIEPIDWAPGAQRPVAWSSGRWLPGEKPVIRRHRRFSGGGVDIDLWPGACTGTWPKEDGQRFDLGWTASSWYQGRGMTPAHVVLARRRTL